jgi:aryl-alcohol dehydrogenase-like predicted oxidoreductase
VGTRRQQALLAAAADAGITHFDTARMYGEGMAERALGRFLARKRSEFTVATKIGFPTSGIQESMPLLLYASRATTAVARRFGVPPRERRRALALRDAEQSFTASLRALRTEWVDILFIHEPRVAEAGAIGELSDWLGSQKRNGRARWLGLSGSASECVRVAQSVPGLFDVMQVEDSIDGREADALTSAGRPLQLTFGYLRRAAPSARDARKIVAAALERNSAGAILVSSRQPGHLRELAEVAQEPRA